MIALLGRLLIICRKFRTLCERRYWRSRFGEAGTNLSIGEHFQAFAPERIRIGRDVVIANRVTLRAMTNYPWSRPPQAFTPEIILSDGCFINNGSQIFAIDKITIGRNVMIAENCFISDNNHGWSDPDIAIKHQPLASKGPITIGESSWLGANTVVTSGVTIGRHCVIGANSVVTRNLPDFCVAAGAPAIVLKKFDPAAKKWVPSNIKERIS